MKKLLLFIAGAFTSLSSFAQDYPYAQDYFYISDSNWTLMTQFPQEGEGILNVYFNGLTYKTEAGGDREYTTIGDMKGPFFGTSNSKNSFYKDENDNNVCIAFQNQSTGFSYTNSKTGVTNAINVASIDYDTKMITLSKAENFELSINGFTPFVSPIALQAPTGVSVYEYDSYSNGELFVKLVNDGQIKSNTPVILKAKESKLYVFDFVDENSYNYSELVKIQNPSQGKPVYFPDVNNDIIYGVQSPHFIPVGSYVFNNDKFTKVETANTALVNSFSCYLKFDEETGLDEIEIVFPEEEEDVLYIHYTDESGSYQETHYQTLSKDSQGKYYVLDLIKFETPVYFVLSSSTFEDTESEVSVVSLDNSSWSGFNGTVFDANMNEIDPTTAEVIKPIKSDEGSYTLKVTNKEDGTPELIELTSTTPTAVKVVTAESDGIIYNVFGQRVDETYKGIVIKNGKKYIQR